MEFLTRLASSFKSRKSSTRKPSLIEPELMPSESYHRECTVDNVDVSSKMNYSQDGDYSAKDPDKKDEVFVRSLDSWNPETCVRLLRMPSVQNYSGLRKLISDSDKDWMVQFLSMGGLLVLFQSVSRLSNYGKSSKTNRGKLEHTMLLLQCVSCLKAVVSSHHALTFIVVRRAYGSELMEVLCSPNSLVKKQLFELLSTLCIFSEDGHHLTLDVFENYRVSNKQRYRFAVLLVEMKQAEVLPYVASLLALINCIILGATGFRIRTRIRNEFLALGLSELLESLQHFSDEDVTLQCTVFDKSRSADLEHATSLGLRSSFSYSALFQAVMDKVEDTPHSASFLILLQNLNLLQPNERKSDYVWSMLEEVTERALSCPETVLRKWILKQLQENVYKSIATQTWLDESECSVPPSVSDVRLRSQCEEDTVSIASNDSGVPVSRTQSWASNDIPMTPPSGPIRDSKCEPFLTKTNQSPEVMSTSEDKNKQTAEAQESPSFEQTQVVPSRGILRSLGLTFGTLLRSSFKEPNSTSDSQDSCHSSESNKSKSSSVSSEELISASYSSSTPIPDSPSSDYPKKKRFLSVGLFSRSKKYSLISPSSNPPEVCVHPPSPDVRRKQAKEGTTSSELKRSRQKLNSELRDCNSLSSSVKDLLTLDGGVSVTSCDVMPRSASLRTPHCEKTCNPVSRAESAPPSLIGIAPLSQPPPPPPPPPPFPTVTMRNKSGSTLDLPSNRPNRSSWCSSTSMPLDQFSTPVYNTLPRPKSKMKTLNWAKIPSAQVKAESIWREINKDESTVQLDFEQMEQLFCQAEKSASPKMKEGGNRARKISQVSLVDSKRSLSIGVFLKQFKGGLNELMTYVAACNHKEIGAEKLRTLIKLLPTSEEEKLINLYTGDLSKLAVPDLFVHHMVTIANVEVRVEGMLLLEEFPTAAQSLHEHVLSLLDGCRMLLANEDLKKFLKLVLDSGNFMNTDSYAGNAVGFRLSTLPKLLETRANRPQITLLHYLVDQSLKKDRQSLNFTEVLLQHLCKCSRLTVDSICNEVFNISKSLKRLGDAIERGDKKLQKHFGTFLENGKQHVVSLERKIAEIRRLSNQLAVRFCEDETKFQLEECLAIFYALCVRIKMAQSENLELKRAEERAALRQKKQSRQTAAV